jgi:acyl dehydratase
MLEVQKKAVAPVFVGDAIWATVEVTDIRPTSKLGRAVLTSQVEIFNQKNETVISYRIVRLLAGRSDSNN